MPIIINSLVAIVLVGLVVFLYLQIRNQHRTQGLSLSDKTNITMMVMNLAALISAIISVNIAVNSYQAAQESGRQQQQTLDASSDFW